MRFSLSDTEKDVIRSAHKGILELPDIKIPKGAQTSSDLAQSDMDVIERLDQFFWSEVTNLDIYALVESVNPVGGHEKAEAVREIVEAEETDIENIVYVGDSITDVEAFRLVRSEGGLAVSFNGNHWAVKEAMIALTANNALPIEWVATAFISHGLDSLTDLMIQQVTDENLLEISENSARIRKTVRTEKIGTLG